MKKAVLILMAVALTSVVLVSCEKESVKSKQTQSGAAFEVFQKPSNDSLDYRTLPHGNKGSGKLGDD